MLITHVGVEIVILFLPGYLNLNATTNYLPKYFMFYSGTRIMNMGVLCLRWKCVSPLLVHKNRNKSYEEKKPNTNSKLLQAIGFNECRYKCIYVYDINI